MDYLIVVDIQNDFVDGVLGTPEAVAIVPHVADKIRTWQGPIFFTLDTHDRDYAQLQEGKFLPVEHCQAVTSGWLLNEQVRNAIRDRPNEWAACRIIEKSTFGSLELVNRLHAIYARQEQSVDSITLVGVCTDICVVSNAMLLKAALPEIPIFIDAHCCAGTTPDNHNAALQVMRQCQMQIQNWE